MELLSTDGQDVCKGATAEVHMIDDIANAPDWLNAMSNHSTG